MDKEISTQLIELMKKPQGKMVSLLLMSTLFYLEEDPIFRKWINAA